MYANLGVLIKKDLIHIYLEINPHLIGYDFYVFVL